MFLLLPALMYIFHVFPFSIVLDIYLGIHQFLQTMEIFTFVQFQEMTNFLNLFKKKSWFQTWQYYLAHYMN